MGARPGVKNRASGPLGLSRVPRCMGQWSLVAPVSGNSLGVWRAEIKPRGLFVQLVQVNTPASFVGLCFGDQILQIDGRDSAGWSTDKAHRAVKRASVEIIMVVRDRPFQRTVTMHKDSTGHVGFIIKKGKVASVVKGSSMARSGLLTNHCVWEVNGQNVIRLKDKEVMKILEMAGNIVTLTIIPAVIYEHMVKKLSQTVLHYTMDHAIPDACRHRRATEPSHPPAGKEEPLKDEFQRHAWVPGWGS